MLYITTSRKPGGNCRQFTRVFAKVTGSIFKNRGKRSLNQVLTDGEKLGCDRLAIISERQGKPDEINVFTTEGWQNPVIKILNFKTSPLPRRLKITEVIATGDERIANVLGFIKNENAAESAYPVILKANEKELTFTQANEKLLEIKRGT